MNTDRFRAERVTWKITLVWWSITRLIQTIFAIGIFAGIAYAVFTLIP